jgi:DNA polymerase I-like protein with 3'-5' exonuclease and polymerase domains
MFGASDKKLGRMVGGGPDVGARVREALLSVSAGFQKLVENLVAEWRKNAKKRINRWNKVEYYNGWVTGLDGRPIFVESEHAILVYVLQSDEAIMMATAYIWLYKELTAKYKWGEDFGIVCWYHDEYTVECRKEIAEDIAKISEDCIARAGKFLKIDCPHEGDSSIGKTWFSIH